MTQLPQRFLEDRAMRDAAKDVLKADWAHAREALTPKSLAGRVGERITDGAKDVVELAKDHADDNKGVLAVMIGAIVLWFSRHPILELLGLAEVEDSETEYDAEADEDRPAAPRQDAGDTDD